MAMTVILQIAGYSNSGKTTLIEKLIMKSREIGLDVGTIKHHGHGKTLKSLDEGKDSWRHRKAGSVATAVAANETLQLQVTKKEPWTVEQLLPIYRSLELDVIFIEGYKKENYPKIVIIRNEHHLSLVNELPNIQAVILWSPLLSSCDFRGPIFYLDEEERYFSWILSFIENQT